MRAVRASDATNVAASEENTMSNRLIDAHTQNDAPISAERPLQMTFANGL